MAAGWPADERRTLADLQAFAAGVPQQPAKPSLGSLLGQTWPARLAHGLYEGARDAVTLPGKVYRGEIDPMSDEGIEQAANLAGNVTLGAFAAPRVAAQAGEAVLNTGAARRGVPTVENYVDPPSQRIADWQWRPLQQVDDQLYLRDLPGHVEDFGGFMGDMAGKAAGPGLSPRDLVKAYAITRSSIQRGAVDADKVRALGLSIPEATGAKVRPEGAFSEWLFTPMGQRYLDAAQRGVVDEDAVREAQRVMRPFGKADTDLPQALNWAAQNLPGREGQASRLVADAARGASSPDEWRGFTSDVYGIGPSKSGFYASLLGRGDQPTLDARQVILHTGQPTKEASRYIARGGGKGGVEAVERLSARQRAMDVQMPAELRPHYQHLTHHAVWDKAGDEITTHEDVVRAMRSAGIALPIGLGALASGAPQE